MLGVERTWHTPKCVFVQRESSDFGPNTVKRSQSFYDYIESNDYREIETNCTSGVFNTKWLVFQSNALRRYVNKIKRIKEKISLEERAEKYAEMDYTSMGNIITHWFRKMIICSFLSFAVFFGCLFFLHAFDTMYSSLSLRCIEEEMGT